MFAGGARTHLVRPPFACKEHSRVACNWIAIAVDSPKLIPLQSKAVCGGHLIDAAYAAFEYCQDFCGERETSVGQVSIALRVVSSSEPAASLIAAVAAVSIGVAADAAAMLPAAVLPVLRDYELQLSRLPIQLSFAFCRRRSQIDLRRRPRFKTLSRHLRG